MSLCRECLTYFIFFYLFLNNSAFRYPAWDSVEAPTNAFVDEASTTPTPNRCSSISMAVRWRRNMPNWCRSVMKAKPFPHVESLQIESNSSNTGGERYQMLSVFGSLSMPTRQTLYRILVKAPPWRKWCVKEFGKSFCWTSKVLSPWEIKANGDVSASSAFTLNCRRRESASPLHDLLNKMTEFPFPAIIIYFQVFLSTAYCLYGIVGKSY